MVFIIGVLITNFLQPKISKYLSGRRHYYNQNYKGRPYLVRQHKPQENIAPYEHKQLEAISRVSFEKTPLMNKSEYGVFKILERLIGEANGNYRIMAQVSMGEIIRPVNNSNSKADRDSAYFAINSKRLDFAIIDQFGKVILAIEYQGHGHYHSRSFLRDAVKREALRKANISFLEVQVDYNVGKLIDSVGDIVGCKISRKVQL